MPKSTILTLTVAALLVSFPAHSQDVITTKVGGGPNGIPALDANLYNPQGVALDSSGNYYIASFNQNRIFKVNTSGVITVVAGSGAQGYAGDGVSGGAGNADLYHPNAVAIDGSGNVYIADEYNCVVRKVDTTNTITTIAGTAGQCNNTGNDLNYPAGVAVDGSGNLYIGDQYNCVVRRVVLSSDTLSTYAGMVGECGYSGNGGPATSAELYYPTGLATDNAGNLYIGDTYNYVIREVTKSSGKINTIAGNHTYGYAGDGNAALNAEMTYPYGVAVNSAGTVVTFTDYNNQRVRQFTVDGNINTIAGNGVACQDSSTNVCGEGGLATSAELDYPIGVAVTSGGIIYFGDNDNYVVDSFTVGGNLRPVAGNHSPNVETLLNNIAPQDVVLNYPFGLAFDSSGDIYIADSHDNMVREVVKSSNLVTYFAGDGTAGYSGDGGTATNAELRSPYGVAADSSAVYIGDSSNCLVRDVTGGDINTFAGLVTDGTPECGYSGNGGSATDAELGYPYGVAVDTKGNVYIADQGESAIRKVSGGVITTIAGIGGISGYSGDGGPAPDALLNEPEGVVVDSQDNVFIADTQNCRVREISAATGIISTVAGNGACTFSGDGVATSNAVEYPQGLAVDVNDNLFVGDYSNRVRWVSPNGIMTTIAGDGDMGYYGDGGLATLAMLSEPTGIVLDSSGDILVSDYNNGRVRSISVFPAVGTAVNSLSFGMASVGTTSAPQQFTVSAYGPVTISNIFASANFSEANDCPSSMPNGSTCTMYVYFTPTKSGIIDGSITINDNGFFNPVNTVSLTGLGSAISITGAPLNFGKQTVKTTSSAKSVTVTNNGSTAIKMGAITLTDTTDFAISANTCPASGSSLAPKASCTISVTFSPQTTGAIDATLVVNDSDPSTPQLVALSGTGTSLVELSTTSVTFPTTAVGATSAAVKITLTNKTGASITLGDPAVTVTGPFANVAGTTCTNSLVVANNGTCILEVAFKPTAVGYASGVLRVFDNNATSPQSATLQGYGTGIKFTPNSVNFGTVTDGQQVSSTVTITNVGKTNVYFTGAELTGANSADFSVNYGDGAPCGNSASNPLLPGGTCQITVYFDPSKVGNENAIYKVFDDSVGSPQALPLTGKGQT